MFLFIYGSPLEALRCASSGAQNIEVQYSHAIRVY